LSAEEGDDSRGSDNTVDVASDLERNVVHDEDHDWDCLEPGGYSASQTV